MKTKPKLVMCGAIFICAVIFSVYFSTLLHNVLSGQMDTLELRGFFKCIGSMAESRQHFMLFLCLVGFSSVLTAVFYLMNLRPYQSHLNNVTPDILTPAAVGQYQHGSAKWLTDNEKDKAFDSFTLDSGDGQIKNLLKTGYAGLDFME
jgi:hypothetical protein